MHIAHIQGIFSPEHGGPTQSLTNYCRGQVAAGHRVSAWVLEGFPHTSAAIRLPAPVEMCVFPVDTPARLGGSAVMRRQIAQAPPADVYHLHGTWLRAMHYGAVEARRWKRPYVLELMGTYEPWALRQKWLQKWLARRWFQDRILRDASCLHVNSKQEAEYLRQLGFKAPVAVIPVGVDIGKIETLKGENPAHLIRPAATFSPADAEKARESGNQKPEMCSKLDGRPFILYLSRLHPKKGLDLLIRAWAANQKAESRKAGDTSSDLQPPSPQCGEGIRESGGKQPGTGNKFQLSAFEISAFQNVRRPSSDFRLVIAGSGDPVYVERCKQLAAELGIANQCLWAGQVDEQQKSWLFTHAHCYVLPTSSENFGNTVAEALAHGTPVITTIHTPWTDLQKYHCGWLVDNTVDDLCPPLNEAIGMDSTKRGAMGVAGLRLVRSAYSLESVLCSVESVYRWVVGIGTKPKCVV